MTDQLLSLAREVGAHIGKKTTIERGVEPYIFITESQLTAFAERTRQDERERILRVAKSRYDHEVAGAVHHVGRWHAAYEYHMTRQAGMSDMLEAIRSSGTSGSKSDE